MLLNDGNLSVDDIKALITKCDKFEFLKVFRDFNKSEAGSGFTGEVFFRHISIMNTVYGSIAYSERETLHLQMACHYESIADSFPAKRTQILPTICYHYLRTGKSAKILERNAELGFELASSCLYPEAQKALVRVKEYIDENRLGLETTLEAHEKYLLEPHFQCKLYSYLALICTMLRQFKDGKELAVSSLLLAGTLGRRHLNW
ncbi:hypothetical protein BC829DRAFT_134695 [Chytridium lagenaria]|nr:hypothetical protein BC829DRAFT_134695 [Chytridium lagenaria]